MGSIVRTIFGGPSKSKEKSSSASSSYNQAYGTVGSALKPTLNYTKQGGDMIGALLGASGGPSQRNALESWSRSSGLDFIRDQGVGAVNASQAGRGMLQSGATGKALMKYGQGLGSTYLNNFMEQLMNFSKLGQGSAGVLGSVGGVSNSIGNSSGKSEGEKKGILPMIAKAVAAGA